MGANYLAALGQAMPAITGTWRDILAQNRESEKWEQEKLMQPLKMETQQAQTELARGGVALQREQIKKYQIEAQKQEEEFKRGETPVDIMGKMKEIGILDDWQGKVANYAKSSGYDTIMKTKDAKPFMEDLFNPKNPMGQQLIGDHYSYYEDLYRQEKESYDKGRYPDVEGKTLTEDKLKPIRNRMNQYKQKADMWMSLKANMSELSKKQAMGEELLGQLDEVKMKYPEVWSGLAKDQQMGLEGLARAGDVPAFTKAFYEMVKTDKVEKKIEPKGTDYKTVIDTKSPTGWSYQSVVDPKAPLVKGAPHPSSEKEGKGKDEESEKRKIGKDAAGLRKEFNNLKEVKDFKDVRSKFQIMEKALAASTKTDNYVAVDQALITLFNKMTDPQSVVRESEYARTPQNLALLNRIKGKMEKIQKGGAGLTQSERNELVNMAKNFLSVYSDLYNNTSNQYKKYSTLSGVDPSMVVGEEVYISPTKSETVIKYDSKGNRVQ
jgi:hypothetical protein